MISKSKLHAWQLISASAISKMWFEDMRLTIRRSMFVVCDREPNIRIPAMGPTEDGSFAWSWAYTDKPGELCVEFYTDGSLDWSFCDHESIRPRGSEEPVTTLPEECLELLSLYADT